MVLSLSIYAHPDPFGGPLYAISAQRRLGGILAIRGAVAGIVLGHGRETGERLLQGVLMDGDRSAPLLLATSEPLAAAERMAHELQLFLPGYTPHADELASWLARWRAAGWRAPRLVDANGRPT